MANWSEPRSSPIWPAQRNKLGDDALDADWTARTQRWREDADAQFLQHPAEFDHLLADVAGWQRSEQRRVLAFDLQHLGQLVEVLRRILRQLVEPPFDSVEIAQNVVKPVFAMSDDKSRANQPGHVSPDVGDVGSDGSADQFGEVLLDVAGNGEDLGRRPQRNCGSQRQVLTGSGNQ